MVNYKIIDTEIMSDKYDISLLDNISKKYLKDDIYFEITDNKIITHLKQLDFISFKKDIQTLTENQNGNGNHRTDYLNSILESIEKIKSYGLKGKKRLYVDYNKNEK